MKKRHILSIALACLLFACDDDKVAGTSFTVTPLDAIAVNSNGKTQTFEIKSDGRWQIKAIGANTSWIQIAPSTGFNNATVTVIIDKNTSVSNRVAELSFVTDGLEKVFVPVQQTGYGPNIVVNASATQLPEEGGVIDFQIATNGDNWEYAITGDNWLQQKEKTPGLLRIYAPINKGREKVATITFKLSDYPTITQTLEIVQVEAAGYAKTITLGAPTDTEINLGNQDLISFDWTSTNVEGGYVLKISSSSDMTNAILEEQTDNLSFSTPSIELDKILYASNLQNMTVYWTVIPKDASVELTAATEIRTLNLIRPEVVSDHAGADLLDAVFAPDTTATDVSGYNTTGHTIQRIFNDKKIRAAYNKTFKRYELIFNPKNGQNASDADYFKIDYATDQNFKDKLADGHTFEVIVKPEFDFTAASPSYETKFFSTHGAGGAGFLVTNASQGTGPNSLAYIINSGGWRWANTQIKPDGKTYYHLVGVYDKATAKLRVYSDGVMKSEVDAPNNYTQPNALWVCIGGDAETSGVAAGCFIGRIALARIYDKALTDTEAKALWDKIKP
ncbi:MAG: hypothetical protein LBS52_04120 [Dysgonamonadaceae bacterium]|jgi:hypothetical protein|nr:hypothetical protein [Dysgonamonadaceae bacterium]